MGGKKKYAERNPSDGWMDTEFASYGTPERPSTSMAFGPKFLSARLYQLSPIEVRTDHTPSTSLSLPLCVFSY